jgi:hypothetical protein
VVTGTLTCTPGLSSADRAPDSPFAAPVPAPTEPFRANAAGPLPKAWTGEAIYPTSTTAILTGQVNARNQRTRFKFQYGLKLPYAQTSEVGEREVTGHFTDSVNEAIGHLKSGSTYHFRIVAFNKYGFVVGKDHTFKTLKGTRSQS